MKKYVMKSERMSQNVSRKKYSKKWKNSLIMSLKKKAPKKAEISNHQTELPAGWRWVKLREVG